jgi:hypothetical protein
VWNSLETSERRCPSALIAAIIVWSIGACAAAPAQNKPVLTAKAVAMAVRLVFI